MLAEEPLRADFRYLELGAIVGGCGEMSTKKGEAGFDELFNVSEQHPRSGKVGKRYTDGSSKVKDQGANGRGGCFAPHHTRTVRPGDSRI